MHSSFSPGPIGAAGISTALLSHAQAATIAVAAAAKSAAATPIPPPLASAAGMPASISRSKLNLDRGRGDRAGNILCNVLATRRAAALINRTHGALAH